MLNIRDCPGRQVPDGAVYIGRTVSRAHRRQQVGQSVSRRYKAKRRRPRSPLLSSARLCGQPKLLAALPELRGRDLVCWCAPLPCHGMCSWNSPTNRPASADPT